MDCRRTGNGKGVMQKTYFVMTSAPFLSEDGVRTSIDQLLKEMSRALLYSKMGNFVMVVVKIFQKDSVKTFSGLVADMSKEGVKTRIINESLIKFVREGHEIGGLVSKQEEYDENGNFIHQVVWCCKIVQGIFWNSFLWSYKEIERQSCSNLWTWNWKEAIAGCLSAPDFRLCAGSTI